MVQAPKVVEERLPANASEFATFFTSEDNDPKRLQRDITREIELRVQEQLFRAAPLTHKLVMQSAAGKNASAFLDATNVLGHPPMEDRSFIAAIHLRMDIPLLQHIANSECGYCSKPINNIHHFFVCNGTRPLITAHRHDAVKLAIARLAKSAGATVMVEPRGYMENPQEGPDLSIMIEQKNYLVDITTRHPVTKLSLREAQTSLPQPGHAAMFGEREKQSKYGQVLGQVAGAEFVPFGIESMGTFGVGAMRLIDTLTEMAGSEGYQFRKSLVVAIGLAMQRGNAEVMLAGLQRSFATSSPLRRGAVEGWV
jgi:hypothetical protein